jgi:hypothetical protein
MREVKYCLIISYHKYETKSQMKRLRNVFEIARNVIIFFKCVAFNIFHLKEMLGRIFYLIILIENVGPTK